MGGMVHGFKKAVGGGEKVEGKKKGNNVLWTAAIVALGLALIAWGFGR
jgi:hypothetical protein